MVVVVMEQIHLFRKDYKAMREDIRVRSRAFNSKLMEGMIEGPVHLDYVLREMARLRNLTAQCEKFDKVIEGKPI